jgi:hypothetical protein
MVEVTTYELGTLKLSLDVKKGREGPSWTVRLNTKHVHGGERTSYQAAVKVYDAVERAIDIIAKHALGYSLCQYCDTLTASVIAPTTIWYDEDDERISYTQNCCPECIKNLGKQGALKE